MRVLSPNGMLWLVIVVLFSSSAYFIARVQSRRRQWAAYQRKPVQATSGEIVKMVKVLDGDEVAVKGNHGNFVVRLLGIKAFSPKVNETGLSEIAGACLRELRQTLAGKKITIEFDRFNRDRAGRVLAYLRVQKQDVGRRLLQEGYALAYLRDSHAREPDYLLAEMEAQASRRGLWANPRATLRATALQTAWEARRSDD